MRATSWRSVRSANWRHRRERRVDLATAHEIERQDQRLVVAGIQRDVGLRAGLLLTIAFEVAEQGRFAAQVVTGLDLLRYVLQHLDVGRDPLGLDRAAGRREVARRGEPQRAIAGAERNDGLHRALAE